MKPNVAAMQATIPSPITMKTAAGDIAPHETVTYADTTAGAMTLNLPPASRAQPQVMYWVRLMVDNGNLTVTFPEGAHNPADAVLTAVADHIGVMSDGYHWYLIVDVTT